jgi:hypothetical protein
LELRAMFKLNDVSYRLLPMPVATPGGTSAVVGALWTAVQQSPNDDNRTYYIVGMAANHTKARANSISSLGAGDGNVIKGGSAFILDALTQASVTGFQPFPGPVPLPGFPGVTCAPLMVSPHAKITMEGVLEVAGAGNVLSSDVETADLFLVLIDSEVLWREYRKRAQAAGMAAEIAKRAGLDPLSIPTSEDVMLRSDWMRLVPPDQFRPVFVNFPATTAATSARGETQRVVTSTWAGPISFVRQMYYRTLTEPDSEAAASMTQTHRVKWNPQSGRSDQTVPWFGMVPAVLLGGGEQSAVAGMLPYTLQMDVDNGQLVKVTWDDPATGSANDYRVDQILMGFEVQQPKTPRK